MSIDKRPRPSGPTSRYSVPVLAPACFVLNLIGLPLPGTSSVTVPLDSAETCRTCHGGFATESAYDTWAGSSMGHAARDPLFLSAVDEAEKDLPGAGDFCLRCHAPEAWLQGRCFPTDGSALLPEDSGVTCTVCHRMDPSPWQRNGQYTIGEDIVYRGPYVEVKSPHRAQFGAWISDSALCGSCHNLRNPLVFRRNLDGTLTDQPFPEQTTYHEWEQSAFAREGRSCQSCHMPSDEGRVAMEGPIRSDRSSHALAGGNIFVQGAISFLEPGLGLQAQLLAGRARTEAMLRSAASLELQADVTEAQTGDFVRYTFRITNLSGHKLPTGYPDGRRVWLSLRIPELAVDRGRFDIQSGEPESPIVVYRSVQGRYGVGPGHRLVLNDTIYFDNRIPARGMAVTATIAPVGKTYPEVEPGILAHWDELTITATVPCGLSTNVLTAEAALLYQAVTQKLVEDYATENGDTERAARLYAAFAETDPGPLEMARVRLVLPVVAGAGCVDAGVGDAAGQDAQLTDAGLSPMADASVTDAGSPADEDGGCGCSSQQPRSERVLGLLALLMLSRCRRRGE